MSDRLIDPASFADLQDSAGAEFVVELVETFADEAPRIVIELRAAHADHAAERFRRAAHSLKSNGSTFGAIRLAEMARALELGGLPESTGPIDALTEVVERSIAELRARATDGQRNV